MLNASLHRRVSPLLFGLSLMALPVAADTLTAAESDPTVLG